MAYLDDQAFVVLDSKDNVGTTLVPITAGTILVLGTGDQVLTIKEDIPGGHKFALTMIQERCPVTKYGETIGRALTNMPAGCWVHVHNVESLRGRGDRFVEERSS